MDISRQIHGQEGDILEVAMTGVVSANRYELTDGTAADRFDVHNATLDGQGVSFTCVM